MRVEKSVLEFQWDKGNIDKNKVHKVDNLEAEEVFLNHNQIIFKDTIHSKTEDRYIIIGQTKKRRLLFIAFTKRKSKVRIISVRDINKKEVHIYEKKAHTTKI